MQSAPHTSARAFLGDASECIRKAMETWNAADLARVADAQRLLELAVVDLKQAAGELGRDPGQNSRELRPLAVSVRKSLDRMTRIVDACSAFQRGLAGRLGDPGVAYDASGRVPQAAGSETGRGFEV